MFVEWFRIRKIPFRIPRNFKLNSENSEKSSTNCSARLCTVTQCVVLLLHGAVILLQCYMVCSAFVCLHAVIGSRCCVRERERERDKSRVDQTRQQKMAGCTTWCGLSTVILYNTQTDSRRRHTNTQTTLAACTFPPGRPTARHYVPRLDMIISRDGHCTAAALLTVAILVEIGTAKTAIETETASL